MAKLSIIIPSRDERFLIPTIDDIFRNARGECEVIAVLDSDKWPDGWKEVTDRHPNLHTIHHGEPKGMRAAINSGVASAKSRGAKWIMKSDGHCSFSEGFDEVLKAECEPDWVVVPRRGRLDPENWTATETHKPDIDYHYLSFPDDPNDFGGPGLNGKIWPQRALERADYDLDEEMSSQGSCWFMHTDYFYQLELMNDALWGTFWCEFQEVGFHCWFSGGRVMVNKKAKYLHLHKGKTYGRGYHLPERELKRGRDAAMLWPWNEEWPKQTKPFSWLIEHFWPVPTWPENWEEVLYAKRKPRLVSGIESSHTVDVAVPEGLFIRFAYYGCGPVYTSDAIDVTERIRELVFNNSLDIIVNNSTITPNENPFRGKKKKLWVAYSFDGGPQQDQIVEEKDWLIIGPVVKAEADGVVKEVPVFQPLRPEQMIRVNSEKLAALPEGVITGNVISGRVDLLPKSLTTPVALNDYLIRRFQISPQRLRGPMPIELRDFHRNDLAQLFAELGFKRGAEIGVAEGNYSEVLLKANPECELLLVDPWHHYSDNPQGKSKEKHEYAMNEVRRKTKGYKRVTMIPRTSMDVIFGGDYEVEEESLDWVYCDGNHLFDYAVSDLIWWSRRVRSGGIVSGDDYYALDQKRWIGGGVVEAVQAYTNAHRIPIWFLFSGHKSVDFMWVKP